MASNIFIDSDVVIDFFTDRDPHVDPASELFDLSEKGEINLFLSALSIANIYYIVRRYLGHVKTLDVIVSLLEMTQVVSTTESEILQALKNNFKDFEDSIQYSTALTVSGVEAIVTRNVRDYRNSEIAVFTPQAYLNLRGSDLG